MVGVKNFMKKKSKSEPNSATFYHLSEKYDFALIPLGVDNK